MRRAVAGPLLVAAAALGCAQPGSPPGGEPDVIPPRVLEVVPEALGTLLDDDAPVVIRFNERISERLDGVGNWEEAVLVSPATSPVRVRTGRRSLEISLVRGWVPDRVYRVVVRPVYRDLFGNARVEPIDLVFSTGAPIPEGALAGFVTDRLTGSPVTDARVEARRGADEPPHVSLTDSVGFFAMPFMAGGDYSVRAWVDQDRDRAPAFFEMQDSTQVAFGSADTAVVELALLRPDTTPARLARAEPIDSARVRLVFDDYFAPGPVDGEVRLYALPDTTLVGRPPLFHPARLDSILAAEAGLAADAELGEAEAAEGAEGEEEAERPRQGPPAADQRGGPPLPSQELILRAPDLLHPDSAYLVRVQGLTNIRGVPGGGGTASFRMPPRPAPADTVPGDTIPADTTPPDSVPPAGGAREPRDAR